MKHTIQALVENKFGVLARVASLFSARGYNISSLAVGETQDPSISCMTIVVNAEDERMLQQIKDQLQKLIDVITVIDFTRKKYIDRELILCKIDKGEGNKGFIANLVKQFQVKIVEESDEYFFLEICADTHQIKEVLKEIKKIKTTELVRAGKIAIGK